MWTTIVHAIFAYVGMDIIASTAAESKSLADAGDMKNTDIAALLKLPPVKLHCSMLAEDAIKAAIDDLKSKAG